MIILGVSWLLSALGVYVRDIVQVVGMITTVLLYLSPIFYPISILPKTYQMLMQFSPLTYVVEQSRNIMLWKQGMDWNMWAIYTFLALVTMCLGFIWFRLTKKGFADVI
jgi:lipopolysaccharide transport system permease protein